MPSEIERLLRKASSLLDRNSPLEARAYVEQGLALEPEHGSLLKLMGGICYQLGDYPQARAAFETAQMLVPFSSAASCLLADCYTKTGSKQSALDLLHAVWNDGDCREEVLPILSAALGRAGDFSTAAAVCRRAANLNPQMAEPLFGLTFYLRRQGYTAAVVLPIMQQAVTLAPEVALYRTLLAFLLAEADRVVESYAILREVTLSEVRCPCDLRRAMGIFRQVGDYHRWGMCLNLLNDFKQKRQSPGSETTELD